MKDKKVGTALLGVEWVTVMSVLNLIFMIHYAIK